MKHGAVGPFVGRALLRLVTNLRWGAAWGLIMGVIYCVIGIVLRFAGGPNFLSRYGITFEQLLLLYLGASVAGGLAVGALRPLTRWRAGAIIVGVAVAFVVYGGIFITLRGPVRGWHSGEWIVTSIAALLTGSYLGNSMWEDTVEPTLPPPELPPGPAPPRRPLGQWRPK